MRDARPWNHNIRTHWESTAPTIWPPPETYAGVRAAAAPVLPGARMRRRLLWRYTLVWTKPATCARRSGHAQSRPARSS